MDALARRLFLLFVLAGCSNSVDIVAECEPVGAPVRLLSPDEIGTFVTGLGTVNGATLVVHAEAVDSSLTSDFLTYARWFDEELSQVGVPMTLGSQRPFGRSDFVVVEGAATAQMWIDPTSALPTPREHELVGFWRFSPFAAPETTPVSMPIGVQDCPSCDLATIAIGGSGLLNGSEGAMPIAAGFAAIAGLPEGCRGDSSSLWRLLAYSETDAAVVRWTPRCDNIQDAVSHVQLVPIGDEIGVLFRLGTGTGLDGRGPDGESPGLAVHYLRMDRDFNITVPPVRVGERRAHPFGVFTGYQPKAAALGDGRLVFSEMVALEDGCYTLRVLNDDGTKARRAPWQFPCMDNRTRYHTKSNDLVELPNGLALAVWSERNAFNGEPYSTRVDDRALLDEGIHVTVVTSDGRRGSNVIEVTDAAATALGPTTVFPRDFLTYVAVDGWDVVVGWADSRADAPGFYARRLRCGPIE